MIDTPYFLDSNILISAKNDTYPFDVFPSFWKHMEEAIKSRRIFILDVVRDELLKGEDILNNWIKEIQPIVTKT